MEQLVERELAGKTQNLPQKHFSHYTRRIS
jgi:hypothetical protein